MTTVRNLFCSNNYTDICIKDRLVIEHKGPTTVTFAYTQGTTDRIARILQKQHKNNI